MAKITKDEVLKIAQISCLELHEDEIEPLIKQLESVLTYAERVKEIAEAAEEERSSKPVNVWRDDVVVQNDPEAILAQAPETQEHYFVVPRILDNNQ